MITIRDGIFETNSSSSDYYREPEDEWEESIIHTATIKAKIKFNNESIVKLLEKLEYNEGLMNDVILQELEECLTKGHNKLSNLPFLSNVELSDELELVDELEFNNDEIIFTYNINYGIYWTCYVIKGKQKETKDEFKLSNHIPFKLDDFSDINLYKNKIINSIKNKLKYDIEYYKEHKPENKEEMDIINNILECYENDELFQIIDIYSFSVKSQDSTSFCSISSAKEFFELVEDEFYDNGGYEGYY